MFKAFLIKYAEIGVKGKNRDLFEAALAQQIKYALRRCEGEFRIRRTRGRIYIDVLSDYDYEETVENLKTVCGVSGICPMVELEDEGFDRLCEAAVSYLQGQYPSKFRGIVQFSSDLASKLYAASDLFLMPSKFEPCGLSQMIAMAYGSVPVVRETGGLKDTVEPFNPVEKTGVGFTFKTYNSYDMLDAVWRAYGTFFDKDNWKAVVSNGMKKNFGWEVSAKKYLDIYAGIR